MAKTESELQQQRDFFESYLPRVDSSLTIEEIQSNFTDGVVRGNILEFKTTINDRNAVLFQAIKYLSAMRVKGISIPANILLVSCSNRRIYVYNSVDYLNDIEKVYIGASSKGNSGFKCNPAIEEIDYSEAIGQERVVEILRSQSFAKIHIDENCIVGWARRYYEEKPNARKQDFIGDNTGKNKTLGEIRLPNVFRAYIHPYTKDSNKKFEYLMDKLNDTIQKKNLGAFYTHPLYAQKSLELVRKAIARVPEGNDYIILDRCAGTGNLERFMTEEELTHTIVSTIEYYEYKVLLETFGDKVRHIIPPVEGPETFNAGLVRGADALSEEYINNDIIMQYVDNPQCTIILFENPPYADTTSIEHQKKKQGKSSSEWKNTFAVKQMKQEVKGTALNDLGNVFIWTAFKYYLRQPTDSYIVYSPVKYWKAQHLINKQFVDGFAFNRKHFHTNIDACIMVALWANIDVQLEKIMIEGFDIINDSIIDVASLPVRRIHSSYSSKYYDKRTFKDDVVGKGIVCEKNGDEKFTKNSIRVKPILNGNIIGYMAVYSSGFDNPDNLVSLLTAARYDGNGFFLRSDNYLEKLPMFAAGRYITYNRAWTERARIMKSADGHVEYSRDVQNGKSLPFLRKCLLFTCFEMQNHMREFIGSDGRFYKNQLTLDTTNGETLAAKEIALMPKNDAEMEMIGQWQRILDDAKKTEEYNPSINYGLYQIYKELDIDVVDQTTGAKYAKYDSLRGNLRTMKTLIKQYYNSEIVPTLFEYQFLK